MEKRLHGQLSNAILTQLLQGIISHIQHMKKCQHGQQSVKEIIWDKSSHPPAPAQDKTEEIIWDNSSHSSAPAQDKTQEIICDKSTHPSAPDQDKIINRSWYVSIQVKPSQQLAPAQEVIQDKSSHQSAFAQGKLSLNAVNKETMPAQTSQIRLSCSSNERNYMVDMFYTLLKLSKLQIWFISI